MKNIEKRGGTHFVMDSANRFKIRFPHCLDPQLIVTQHRISLERNYLSKSKISHVLSMRCGDLDLLRSLQRHDVGDFSCLPQIVISIGATILIKIAPLGVC